MPLVPCPECGGQVSPAAVSCPHCGFPLHGQPAAAPVATMPGPSALGGAGPGAGPSVEEVVWEGAPSLRAMAVDAITTGVFALVVSVAVAMAYGPLLKFVAGISREAAAFVAEYQAGFSLAAVLFVVTVVGTRAARLGWRGLALRSHHYRVTSQRVLVESGVLSKAITEIDMRTIEDIALEQTVTQRLFGVGEISIVSSDPGPTGRAKTRLRLLGVRDPRAVRELVRAAAYQATRGQVFMRST